MPDADPFARTAAAFRSSRDRIHILADGLTADQINWKASPTSWSIAECVAHLNIGAEKNLQPLGAALDKAPVRPAQPTPLAYGWVGKWFVSGMKPGTRPMKTFKAMAPPESTGHHSSLDPARLFADFDRTTEGMIAIAERAQTVDAGRVRVGSPFFPLLRMPLVAYLDALGWHAIRHTEQAERVVLEAQFPRPVQPEQ